jgi:uncharacterized small protein (DUF1192 family)
LQLDDSRVRVLQIAKQADEITRLKSELDARPVNPDARIVQLQDEVAGLKMIAPVLTRDHLQSRDLILQLDDSRVRVDARDCAKTRDSTREQANLGK